MGDHAYYVTCTDGNGGEARAPETGELTIAGVVGRSLTGTVNYGGAQIIDASSPLRVEVW